jgi:hypothetical protein
MSCGKPTPPAPSAALQKEARIRDGTRPISSGDWV